MSAENRDLYDYLDALGFGPQAWAPAGAPAATASAASASPSSAVTYGLDLLLIEESPSDGARAELLGKMIAAMGIDPARRQLKSLADMPELSKNLAELRPRVIVAFGSKVAQSLLGSDESLTDLRGRWLSAGVSAVMATHEPALLLQNPAFKKQAWEDLQLVMKKLANSNI